MEQETFSSWPGSIDEVTFTIFSMVIYIFLDIMLLGYIMAYRQSVDGLPILIDSGQMFGMILFSWGLGWFGALIRMNQVCSRRPYMSRDAADMEAFKSLALGILFQLPLYVIQAAIILA